MSYVNPKLKSQFDSLSPELQEAILARDVNLHTLYDLIGVLEDLVRESEE